MGSTIIFLIYPIDFERRVVEPAENPSAKFPYALPEFHEDFVV
jgi:hypothetical protein